MIDDVHIECELVLYAKILDRVIMVIEQQEAFILR